MTNAEKYLKDGVDVEKLAKEFYNYTCTDKADKDIGVRLVDFFDHDVKPTLTEDEKVILRSLISSIASQYAVIGRTKINQLYIADSKNAIDKYMGFGQYFGHIFKSIKERRRILY